MKTMLLLILVVIGLGEPSHAQKGIIAPPIVLQQSFLLAKDGASLFFFKPYYGSLFPDIPNGILKDQRGFLWIRFWSNGLLRFDGTDFRPYRHDPDDPSTLPDDHISDFLEDDLGFIWLATSKGLSRFDPVKNTFWFLPKTVGTAWECLLRDRKGQIWAGSLETHNTLISFNPEQPDSIRFFPFEPSSKWLVRDLAEDAHGHIWGLGHNNQKAESGPTCLFKMEASGGKLRELPTPPFQFGNLRVEEKTQSILVFNNYVGMFIYEPGNDLWRHLCFNVAKDVDNLANNIMRVSPVPSSADGDWWLGTLYGLYLYRPSNGQLWRLTPPQRLPPDAPQSNEDAYIPLLMEPDGNAWFAFNGGIAQLDPYQQQFRKPTPLPADFYPNAIGPHPASGELLFARVTAQNVFHVLAWHPLSNAVREKTTPIPLLRCSFAEQYVRAMFPDRQGRIWVGFRQGLGLLNPQTLKLEMPNVRLMGGSKPGINAQNVVVWDFEEGADGTIWLPTLNAGLMYVQPPHKPTPINGPPMPKTDALTNLLRDTRGRWWVGTNGAGVICYDLAAGGEMLSDNKSKSPGLFVRAIHEDAQGNIWVGTEQGVAKWGKQNNPNGAFERIKDIKTWVTGIAEDNQGRIWAKTNQGLYSIDPNGPTVRRWSYKEGMTAPSGEMEAFFMDKTGHLWLGGQCRFRPDHIRWFPPFAQAIFKGLRIYDRAVPFLEGDTSLPALTLRPDEDALTVSFGALGFSAPEETSFWYSLETGAPRWVPMGQQRNLTFHHLPPGRYTLLVKTRGTNGVEGRTISLPLRKMPYFYQTGWFMGLCALGLLGMGYAIQRYRWHQRLEKERLRLRIARDLHDELGSTLSSISMLSEAALRSVELEMEKARLSSIGEKARNVLSSMRDIVWAVNPQNDAMEYVLQRMARFASEDLEAAGIALDFKVDEGIESLSLPMEKRKEIYLIFKEAIHNCVKHSRASKVEIRLTKEKALLNLYIADDGIGFDPQFPTASLGGNGLKSMQARATKMGATLSLNSTIGKGTALALGVPL